jgi:hypothetical protein
LETLSSERDSDRGSLLWTSGVVGGRECCFEVFER